MMIPIVEFPAIVEHYAPFFEGVFSEEAFIQFKRYISGLLVSENKTIAGINQLFVNEKRAQSSLNGLLTRSPFSLRTLNEARLEMLSSVARTRIKPTKGVLGLDDTLLTHYGQGFEKIAKLWDHINSCYVWSHNLVSLHYSDEQTDYPVNFQLWEPADLEKLEAGLPKAGIKVKESKLALKTEAPLKWRQYLLGLWQRKPHKPEVAALYQSKLLIGQALLHQWVQDHPTLKLPVTFDSWYTQPALCRFISDTLQLPYVGTLGKKDEILLRTGKKSLAEFAADLKKEHLAAIKLNPKAGVFQQITFRYKGNQETYYSYCRTHRIAKFGKQRLVINFRRSDLTDAPVFFISNRHRWQAKGITRIRRHRWPVEVYYEEGKAEGLDQYQLRDFEGISRHVALVAVVYSLLRAAQYDTVLQDTLQRQLKIVLDGSAPFWRQATQADNLWHLALVISSGLLEGKSLATIMAPFIHIVCA
jgi:hypothetical protein